MMNGTVIEEVQANTGVCVLENSDVKNQNSTKKHYPKGSEWRKWDLHMHSPHTHLNNQFETISDEKFIEKIVNSKIAVVGYTNYFKFTEKDIALMKKLREKGITVFPNIEFRLDIKNKANEAIHFHIIFSDSIKFETINGFLGRLKTINDNYCSDLDINDIKETTIGFDTIRNTLKNEPNLKCFRDYILVAGARGQGSFRPGKNNDRENTLAKTIDNNIQIVFGNEDDVDFFSVKEPQKPVFHCSDAHKLEEIGTNTTCVKADPTFEGLKQCIYEPELRVKIQDGVPENKTGYHVIDKISFDHTENSNSKLYNDKIQFNPYLNTVIGGRSTGKSLLLRAIASKCKTIAEQNIGDYTTYAKDIFSNMTIHWKDGLNRENPEIEYFPQNYIFEYAKEENKENLTDLIRGILVQKGKETILNEYEKNINYSKTSVSAAVDSYFDYANQITTLEEKKLYLGDSEGIKKEIQTLEEKIREKTPSQLSPEDSVKLKSIKEDLETFKKETDQHENDLNKIKELNVDTFINSIDDRIMFLSEKSKDDIQKVYTDLSNTFKSNWKDRIRTLTEGLESNKISNEKEISKLKENHLYKQFLENKEKNTDLSELYKKLNQEKEKQANWNKNNEEIKLIQSKMEELSQQINNSVESYSTLTEGVIQELRHKIDDLDIIPETHFDQKTYITKLENGLNRQRSENKEILNFEYKNSKTFIKHIFKLFKKLVDKKVPLKAGFTQQELAKTLLSECFYSVRFDLKYENDTFSLMSEGKKSFVILKLLLDFSDKKCPILIDQPEDAMDNRDIFMHVVKYLRKKKQDRQIILTTHNPNIAVGSDSELIIVANQHGETSKNKDNKKFQYSSGSLEFTKPLSKEQTITLRKQGIREHVCEILEGGTDAFKKREKKYGF